MTTETMHQTAVDQDIEARAERCFQAVLQPLVEKAWQNHCRRFLLEPTRKIDREAWYRDAIQSETGLRSSKGLDTDARRKLIRHFNALANLDAGLLETVRVDGWTPMQSQQYTLLARKAYARIRMRGTDPGDWDSWRRGIFQDVVGVPETISGVDRVHGFEAIMGRLAQVANDEYWLRRLAVADETRMRWQIRRFLGDLSALEGQQVDWSYVRGIWEQSNMLPDLDDAPVETLAKVLAMLDTHIRRLCKRRGIRPCDLPTRGGGQ